QPAEQVEDLVLAEHLLLRADGTVDPLEQDPARRIARVEDDRARRGELQAVGIDRVEEAVEGALPPRVVLELDARRMQAAGLGRQEELQRELLAVLTDTGHEQRARVPRHRPDADRLVLAEPE